MTGAGWHSPRHDRAREALRAAGFPPGHVDQVVALLVAARVLVDAPYYVPPIDDLYRGYAALGTAYIRGLIPVRWVMCGETHDALARQYGAERYYQPATSVRTAGLATGPDGLPTPEALAGHIDIVMRRKTWTDPSKLFGIPIRIDPAARRPMFEIIPKGEPT